MRSRDDGYALLLSLVLAGALAIVGGAGISLCGLALAHAHAGTAADLAALAAASNVGDSCTAAGHIAVANGAELLACTAEGGEALVTVSLPAPTITRWLGQTRLEVTARAGPASN